MNKLGGMIVLLVVVLAVAGWVGYQRGWLEFGPQNSEGKTSAGVTVLTDKLKADKERLQQLAREKLAAVRERLKEARDKAKNRTGTAKAKADKEVETLSKHEEVLQKKAQAIERAAPEQI